MSMFIIISFIVLFLIIIFLVIALFSNDKQYRELRGDFENCCDNFADIKTKLDIYADVYSSMRNTLLSHTALTNRYICKKYDTELTQRLIKLENNDK